MNQNRTGKYFSETVKMFRHNFKKAKILGKGHCQKELDSAYSLMETKLKNKDIKLPSDYGAIYRK